MARKPYIPANSTRNLALGIGYDTEGKVVVGEMLPLAVQRGAQDNPGGDAHGRICERCGCIVADTLPAIRAHLRHHGISVPGEES